MKFIKPLNVDVMSMVSTKDESGDGWRMFDRGEFAPVVDPVDPAELRLVAEEAEAAATLEYALAITTKALREAADEIERLRGNQRATNVRSAGVCGLLGEEDMTTETMMERVARAICGATICDPHTIDPEDLPGLIDQWTPDSVPAARAALQALREPSISMCMAGESAAFDAEREERRWLDDAKEKFGGVPSFISRMPQATFTAMIDATLQERQATRCRARR